jgi:hypothetical protein
LYLSRRPGRRWLAHLGGVCIQPNDVTRQLDFLFFPFSLASGDSWSADEIEKQTVSMWQDEKTLAAFGGVVSYVPVPAMKLGMRA